MNINFSYKFRSFKQDIKHKWWIPMENIQNHLHNGVVVIKISRVIHLINIIKLSVCTWWNFTLNLLKHFIFPTFLNELFFTISDNIFRFPEKMVENYVFWMFFRWIFLDGCFSIEIYNGTFKLFNTFLHYIVS